MWFVGFLAAMMPVWVGFLLITSRTDDESVVILAVTIIFLMNAIARAVEYFSDQKGFSKFLLGVHFLIVAAAFFEFAQVRGYFGLVSPSRSARYVTLSGPDEMTEGSVTDVGAVLTRGIDEAAGLLENLRPEGQPAEVRTPERREIVPTPVVIATLSGIDFVIDPQGPQAREVKQKHVRWTWRVKAEKRTDGVSIPASGEPRFLTLAITGQTKLDADTPARALGEITHRLVIKPLPQTLLRQFISLVQDVQLLWALVAVPILAILAAIGRFFWRRRRGASL